MTQPSANRILIGAISPAAPGPLYQQIVDGVKREISGGRISPGDELPSFRALAEQLLVSLITVRRAYSELEAAGLIQRRQGQGTFVAEHIEQASAQRARAQAREHLAQAVTEARQRGPRAETVTALVQQTLEDHDV